MKSKKDREINVCIEHRKKIIISALVLILALIAVVLSGLDRNKKEISSIDFSSELKERINKIVSGYPIEEMALYISQEDRITAAFLVAIAKKESNWGKFSPQKDGKTCYNYWGYRGTYNQTDSGYSCFNSPEQAVEIVGERIGEFIDRKIDNPKKMANAWKCGFDCSSHSFWSVKKWEWDVDFYFQKIYN